MPVKRKSPVLRNKEELIEALKQRPESVTVEHGDTFSLLCEWQEKYRKYRIVIMDVLPGAYRCELMWSEPKQPELLK